MRNYIKRLLRLFIPAAAGALILSGCSLSTKTTESDNSDSTTGTTESVAYSDNKDTDKKLSIVTTTFPEYDWVRNILGDKAEDTQLTLLCKNGNDIHSYQPTVDDILKISESDIFIYNGGESYIWVDDALSNVTNADMIDINLLAELGNLAKEEESIEGMQAKSPESNKENNGMTDSDEEEYDEHIWLSLRNAAYLTDRIAETLILADEENADIYRENANKYKDKLDSLDEEYKKVIDEAEFKTLLFADRFPFRYLTDDYGLEYFAAFAGCSAETEASFATIAFLSEKTDELSLKHIMVIENSDKKIAETVISNTASGSQDILELNSMQSVTDAEINEGEDYLSVMNDNLNIIEKALN